MLYVSRRDGDVLVRADALRGVLAPADTPSDIEERLAEDATQRAIVRLLTRLERQGGGTGMVPLRWADIEAELLLPE
jgi:hypothetical protein